jgi:hypothetical protein
MNAPVLLIIYKRPELTQRALALIAAAKPSRLFVAADGPRSAEEAKACRAAREAVAQFTGDCEVVTNFADENLGCGVRVHTAISWAFTMTEQLVILEDDCVPNASFFRFCNQMLETYRDDDRVMHVSGNNFVGPSRTPYSYYFSKYTHAWGWATWRHAWSRFDWQMVRWPEMKAAGIIENWCSDPYEQLYWRAIFDKMHGGARDVWDYMWMFACWSNSGLSILPSLNLVGNEGWGPDATHTVAPFPCPPTGELNEITHPPSVMREPFNDAITFDRNFGGAQMRAMDTPRARLRRRIAPLLWPARVVKRSLMQLMRRRGAAG